MIHEIVRAMSFIIIVTVLLLQFYFIGFGLLDGAISKAVMAPPGKWKFVLPGYVLAYKFSKWMSK